MILFPACCFNQSNFFHSRSLFCLALQISCLFTMAFLVSIEHDLYHFYPPPRPPDLQVSWKQNQVDKKLQQQQKMRKIGFLSYFHIMQNFYTTYYDWMIITTKKIVIVMRIYIRLKKNLQSPPKQASSSHISHNCYNRDSLRKRKKLYLHQLLRYNYTTTSHL